MHGNGGNILLNHAHEQRSGGCFPLPAPVIASDIVVHREVGGQAAVYTDPADPAAWAREMHSVLETPSEAGQLLACAEQFSWAKTARAFRELYSRWHKP